MRIDDGLLLRGASVPLQNLGTIRSPILSDIYQDILSVTSFNVVSSVVFCGKAKMKEMLTAWGIWDDYADLTDLAYDEASKFELVIHSPYLRETVRQGLLLFFVEDIVYEEEYKGFLVIKDKSTPVGIIDNDNFLAVEDLIKQALYSRDEEKAGAKFASQTAKEWWEEANRLEDQQPKNASEDYQLTNIISKLSCVDSGYTLLTIYQLSVYQLYDQFYAYCQNRLGHLSENAYAHNGGDDFDHLAWLHKNSE